MVEQFFNTYIWFSAWLCDAKLTSSWLFFSETLFTFSKDTFYYSYSTNYTFIFTLKMATCLVFLSAIRGGVPRYRYDFLTKMGWVKFLGLVLAAFLTTFLLFIVW